MRAYVETQRNIEFIVIVEVAMWLKSHIKITMSHFDSEILVILIIWIVKHEEYYSFILF